MSRKEAPFQHLDGNIANNELSKGNAKDPTTGKAKKARLVIINVQDLWRYLGEPRFKSSSTHVRTSTPAARLRLPNN